MKKLKFSGRGGAIIAILTLAMVISGSLVTRTSAQVTLIGDIEKDIQTIEDFANGESSYLERCREQCLHEYRIDKIMCEWIDRALYEDKYRECMSRANSKYWNCVQKCIETNPGCPWWNPFCY
ncbi:MAG TPA: hypothetical protein VJJ22_02005 [Candidatus Paceibacterota bacterium]